MSEQEPASASAPAEQPIISFVFVLTQAEANTVVQALDELPGKFGRPITQKMIMQSNQQPDLITNVTAQFQRQLAAHGQQSNTSDGLTPSTPAVIDAEDNTSPTKPLRTALSRF